MVFCHWESWVSCSCFSISGRSDRGRNMMDALHMRVLGLPAWAWGAILGVGVVAYMHFHSSSGGADPNSAATDPNAVQDANGNPISSDGLAGVDTDAGADSGGYFPGPIGGSGGFNYATPAPAPNPNGRIDPKIEKELQTLLREERREHKHKRNRKGTKRVPAANSHHGPR